MRSRGRSVRPGTCRRRPSEPKWNQKPKTVRATGRWATRWIYFQPKCSSTRQYNNLKWHNDMFDFNSFYGKRFLRFLDQIISTLSLPWILLFSHRWDFVLIDRSIDLRSEQFESSSAGNRASLVYRINSVELWKSDNEVQNVFIPIWPLHRSAMTGLFNF